MRAKAILDAKERATVLTKPLNQNIGPAIYIASVENVSPQIRGRAAGIQVRGLLSSWFEDYNAVPKIEFEKIEVSANINAKFILR